jgi:hypothetical protein
LAAPADYTFTKIATRADGVSQFLNNNDWALADDGSVIFYAEGLSFTTSYFIGDGQSLAPVNFPQGGGGTLYPAVINSAGVAAATTNPRGGQVGVFIQDNATTIQIDLKPSTDLGAPDINEQGQVAYVRRIDPDLTQLLVADGQSSTIIANSTVVGYLNSGWAPSLNNLGQVAFRSDQYGVLIGQGGETQPADYIQIAGSRESPGVPSLNDFGVATFTSSKPQVGKAIAYGSGGPLTYVADVSGPFASFGQPAINNENTIAFKGALDDGTEGIYLTSDPVAGRVIASGDPLRTE